MNKMTIYLFKGRTNSCVDTLELRMPNNHSQNGFGYKHRPGLLSELFLSLIY